MANNFEQTLEQFKKMMPPGTHIITDKTQYTVEGYHVTEQKGSFWKKPSKTYQFDFKELKDDNFATVHTNKMLQEALEKLQSAYDAAVSLNKFYVKTNHKISKNADNIISASAVIADKLNEWQSKAKEADDKKVTISFDELDALMQTAAKVAEGANNEQKNSSRDFRNNRTKSTRNEIQHSKTTSKRRTRRPD